MARWLDMNLITGPYFCLCQDKKSFKKALNHLKIKKSDRPEFLSVTHANANVHIFYGKSGLTAIVCLGDTSGATPNEIVGLLIHEAVHIWQHFKDHIGETHPSKEFEAYSIQTIAQRLIEEFEEVKSA